MTTLFPHTPYAEEQPLSHTILITHVLDRGFQTGAVFGSLYGAARHAYVRRTTSSITAPILRSAGVGGVIGIALSALATGIRMWGREKIEWQDRAWRLLENKGQVECDTFATEGAVAGVAAVAWRHGVRTTGWRTIAGGAGLGSLVGVIGYMGWRYGVKGGKWEEAVELVAEEVNPAMPVQAGKADDAKH